MTLDEMLSKLRQYLTEYNACNFRFCMEFLFDLKNILSNISHQKTFFNQFVATMNNIKEYRHNIYQIDSHERLKGCPFYSIHLQCKNYNIRFLIKFDSSGNPIFLVAFEEKTGKRFTSYQRFVKKAYERDD